MDNNTNPVFIGGHRRSGTTLFNCLLENHPDLLVYPPDSGFFYAFYPEFEKSKYSNQDRINQILNFCIKNMELFLKESFPGREDTETIFSIKKFKKQFLELSKGTDCSSKALLISLMTAYHASYGFPKKPRHWVEKTTSSEIYAAEAFKWFPHAKFIHVLRDPRDNWSSLKSGWETRFKDYNDNINRLMHSMIERGKFGFELSVKNQLLFGENKYKVIRYEDLVDDTTSVMTDVCNFIGIPFTDEVQLPTICGQLWQGNNYGGKKYNKASSYNAGRWKERISKNEAMLLEYHFEDYMNLYNYPLTSKLKERHEAAVDHYKWYNYAQAYSFTSTNDKETPEKKGL